MPFEKYDTLIREANLADLPKIYAILTQIGLSAHDVLVTGTRYWLAEDIHKQSVGTIGLELGQDTVLLRSAAVSLSHQNQGIGNHLVQRALYTTEVAGYHHIYLFSTEAGAYWQRFGFCEVPVSELVSALPDAPQVKQYAALGWLSTEVAWHLALESSE